MPMQTITVVLDIDCDRDIDTEDDLQSLLNASMLATAIDSIEITNLVNGDKLAEKPQHFSDRELAERGLPPFAYARHSHLPEVIMIERGMLGFFPQPNYGDADPDALNAELGVSEDQAEAMHWGSLFGWHTPGAWPEAQKKLRTKESA